jgi:hypothetical protein
MIDNQPLKVCIDVFAESLVLCYLDVAMWHIVNFGPRV